MIEAVAFSKRQAPQPRLSKKYVPGRWSERFWSEAEDDILRATFPDHGAAACREILIARGFPDRSPQAIYSRTGGKLGLKSAHRPDRRTRHPPNPELDATIRAAWPGLSGKGAVKAFAASIGVERWLVSKRAAALGLAKPHSKEPSWTAAEDALLARVPLHAPDKAAAIFREHGFARSATAIIVRAKRIGISRRRSDVLSAGRAAEILGVDVKWVTARCIDARLAAEKRGTRRLVQQGGDTWSIRPADLRRFVLDNLIEIDIRKVEKFSFVALLVEDAATQASAAGVGGD